MKRARLILVCLTVFLFLVSCGAQATPAVGTYHAEGSYGPMLTPSLELAEDGTFRLCAGSIVSAEVAGTYTFEDGTLCATSRGGQYVFSVQEEGVLVLESISGEVAFAPAVDTVFVLAAE